VVKSYFVVTQFSHKVEIKTFKDVHKDVHKKYLKYSNTNLTLVDNKYAFNSIINKFNDQYILALNVFIIFNYKYKLFSNILG
jgi:hypothetical protein